MWAGWGKYVENEDRAATCMVFVYRFFKARKQSYAEVKRSREKTKEKNKKNTVDHEQSLICNIFK